MQALEVPQSASMQGYLAAEDWDNAYKASKLCQKCSRNVASLAVAPVTFECSLVVRLVALLFKSGCNDHHPFAICDVQQLEQSFETTCDNTLLAASQSAPYSSSAPIFL